ncbi:MAG TPA: DUF1203 domain-containing protein [Salinarimonas sp.]|jgi:hypothetical protein|nr:DUF1203 domain-containing protein [Salinarimonas sp.]
MTYRIEGLAPEPFRDLFALDDAALAALGARRVTAEPGSAYPCRIGLRWAEPGETLLLVNHVHQPEPSSPYRASGPIFVARDSAAPARHEGALPPMIAERLVSLRAYDGEALIVDAEVAEGEGTRAVLERFLARPDVAEVHIHFARRGCFAARAVRA